MPGPSNQELGGPELYQASDSEVFVADFAANLIADFPGITPEALESLNTDVDLGMKFAKLLALRDRTMKMRINALISVRPETTSAWSATVPSDRSRVYHQAAEPDRLTKIDRFCADVSELIADAVGLVMIFNAGQAAKQGDTEQALVLGSAGVGLLGGGVFLHQKSQ